MYAVVKTGGKQYKVAVGEKIKVEQISADVDSQLVLSEVLMIVGDDGQVNLGSPVIPGAEVKVTVLFQGRHDKVRIFKMRRRKHYQKRQGHRQHFTQIRVDEISV